MNDGVASDAGTIFTDAFLAVDAEKIARALRDDGVFALEGAFTPEFLDGIAEDVQHAGYGMNLNGVHGVHFGSQYYVTHMLAASHRFFEYCTHPRVLDICQHILQRPFRLKAQRYYETYGGHSMRWHTDNKTDRSFAHIPGIIFIAYLSDVFDGEFQYVRGSHRWSGEKAYNEYDQDEIERRHGADVLGFRKPRGTVLIYDTYGIHRARPVASSQFVRKSLFFQVDSRLDDGEPILLKTEFVGRLDERLQAYLGFGRPSDYRSFPDTGLDHLPVRLETLALIPRWIARRALRASYERLPDRWQRRIKTALGRP